MVISGDAPIPDLPGMTGRRLDKARPDLFTSPLLAQLFTWWQEAARQGSGPPRPPLFATFDITAHRPLTRNIFVAAEQSDGYVLRLAGEDYLQIFGIKKGHQWRRENDNPLERDFALYVDFVRRQGMPYYGRGPLELGPKNWVAFETLFCPLTHDPADKITLIGLSVRLPSAED